MKAYKIEYRTARKFLCEARKARAKGMMAAYEGFLAYARAARSNARKHRQAGV
jgi:hypothetical protein